MAEGDRRAHAATFEACYEQHRQRVYRLCLRYSGGKRGFAEDVTHDVFLKLWEHLPRLSTHEDIGAWLYRVTANVAVSAIRREKSLLRRMLGAAREPERQADLSAEAQLAEHEQARAALAVLSTLPGQQRIALCMKLLDGKSQREVAEALSVSEGYVSKLIARAEAHLRAHGWEVDDAK